MTTTDHSELLDNIPVGYFTGKDSGNYCFYNPPNLAAAGIEDEPAVISDLIDKYRELHEISIYVNIPFCERRCLYCNYCLYTYDSRTERFLENTLEEFAVLGRQIGLAHKKTKSVYFGGGTPSLLSKECLARILSTVLGGLTRDSTCEITFECCPEADTADKLNLLKELGITRLSFGIESLSDDILRALNRRHDSRTAAAVVTAAGKIFDNVNVDLIYGLPNQRMADWVNTLETAIGLGTSGITAYKLAASGFGRSYRARPSGMIKDFNQQPGSFPDERATAQMYLRSRQILREAGFEEALVGFFIRPKVKDVKVYRERWAEALPVYGCGLGAFSYGPFGYLCNEDDIEAYASRLREGRLPVKHVKAFGPKETLLFRLLGRFKAGSDFQKAEANVLQPFLDEVLSPSLALGFVEEKDGMVSLTVAGRAFVDRLAFDVLEQSRA